LLVKGKIILRIWAKGIDNTTAQWYTYFIGRAHHPEGKGNDMKYNLTAIMTEAHSIRRTLGRMFPTMSAALRQAWYNAKRDMKREIEKAEMAAAMANREAKLAKYTADSTTARAEWEAQRAAAAQANPELADAENQLMCLECKERWNDADRAKADELEVRINALRAA